MKGKGQGIGPWVEAQDPGEGGWSWGAQTLARVPECLLCLEGKGLDPMSPFLSLTSPVEPIDRGQACKEQMLGVLRAKAVGDLELV